MFEELYTTQLNSLNSKAHQTQFLLPFCLRTLKTLIWHEPQWISLLSLSSYVYDSTCKRNGTPFSPPCFLAVNSVLIQLTLTYTPVSFVGSQINSVPFKQSLSMLTSTNPYDNGTSRGKNEKTSRSFKIYNIYFQVLPIQIKIWEFTLQWFFFLMNQHSSTNLINEQGYDKQRKK